MSADAPEVFVPLETARAALGTGGTGIEVALPGFRLNGIHLAPGETRTVQMLAEVTFTGPAAEERPNELEDPDVH